MNLGTLTEQIQKIVGSEVDGDYGIETATAILAFLRKGGGAPTTDVPAGPSSVTDTDLVDDRSEGNLATLQKEVRPYFRSLIHAAAKQGMTVKLISGTRTYAEQDALYERGRSKPGRIVTNARGGQSNHNFGIAGDFGIFVEGEYIDESLPSRQVDAMYSALGAIGRSLGLDWGGDWRSLQDMPHFQLRPKWAKSMSEGAMLAELRKRHDAGTPIYP